MVRVVQLGLGPLGQHLTRCALARPGLQIVAAVDPAPDKVGRDVGELAGAGPLGVPVCANLAEALKNTKANVALVTTVSSLRALEEQVYQLAQAGLYIVSTCEELVFPWGSEAHLAKAIDAVCKTNRVACVGTGVNPGFMMDYLPVVLSALCQRVEQVKVARVQDASNRRLPFQAKIGVGLTPEQFDAKRQNGGLGHVGLVQSLQAIAQRLGWNLTATHETTRPILASTTTKNSHKVVQPGMVRGIHQVATGFIDDREVVVLDFRAAVGEPIPYDEVEIIGEPCLKSTIQGGVNGDVATCAIILNAVRSILQAAPGLKTMLDLPPVAYNGAF